MNTPTTTQEATKSSYAISHLEEHAASIRETIKAYTASGDHEPANYWKARLASVTRAIETLGEVA